MSKQLPAVEIARRKVLAWMQEQEARGVYPWAWRSPHWDEYVKELRRMPFSNPKLASEK